MIGIVTTLATAFCTNCQAKIRQTKSDLSSTAEWCHDDGQIHCARAPVAEPIEKTVTPVPELEVVECEWTLKQYKSAVDWVAHCPRCDRLVAQEWAGRPGGQMMAAPVYVPVCVHRKEEAG